MIEIRSIWIPLTCLLATLALAGGCVSAQSATPLPDVPRQGRAPATTNAPPQGESTLPSAEPLPVAAPLKPGDTLRIFVQGEPSLSNSFDIAPDGTIQYPLLGWFQVSGKNTATIQQEIQAKLADGFLRDPHVRVWGTTAARKQDARITVTGKVRTPGVVALAPGLTVIEAINQAGGLAEFGSLGNVKVVRKQGDASQVLELDLDDIDKGMIEDNIELRAGDLIVVGRHWGIF